jgi:hypothetical protein
MTTSGYESPFAMPSPNAIGDRVILHVHYYHPIHGLVCDPVNAVLRSLSPTSTGMPYGSFDRIGGGGFDGYFMFGQWHHGRNGGTECLCHAASETVTA